MTRRILGALRSIVAEPRPDDAVEVHGEPAACFDAHCSRPAL